MFFGLILVNSTLEPNCTHFRLPLGRKGCTHCILGEFWIGICFFSLPIALPKICKYLWYPQMFPFCGYQLDGKLFCFFTLPGKVYADVINGLQYCVAIMQTKSEMYAKYGHEIYFGEKYDYKTRLSIKTAPKKNRKWSIFKTLSLIWTINFNLWL